MAKTRTPIVTSSSPSLAATNTTATATTSVKKHKKRDEYNPPHQHNETIHNKSKPLRNKDSNNKLQSTTTKPSKTPSPPVKTIQPPYSYKILWSRHIIQYHIILHAVPDKFIIYNPTSTHINIDTSKWSTHYLLRQPYPGNLIVNIGDDRD